MQRGGLFFRFAAITGFTRGRYYCRSKGKSGNMPSSTLLSLSGFGRFSGGNTGI